MRTPRLASSRLNWRPQADLNGLVRFAERPFLVSMRLPSHFNWPLPQHAPRRLQLKCDDTRWRNGGEVKGNLANGVGSPYPSHYLRTWCIQHYYRWCAHLGWPVVDWTYAPRWFKWTRPFRKKTKYGFCACAITFQLVSTTQQAVGGTVTYVFQSIRETWISELHSAAAFRRCVPWLYSWQHKELISSPKRPDRFWSSLSLFPQE